jgi:cell division protein FtsB
MRYAWSRLIIACLVVEASVFAMYYRYGPRGIVTLHYLKRVKKDLQVDIDEMIAENDRLQAEIDAWATDEFLQEKYAREKLYLQKQGEVIYFKE